MAPHSSTLAWKIPWMEEPGGLQYMVQLRVRHDLVTSLSLFTFMHWRRKWQPSPVFLPGESQGRGSLVGCHLWDRTESDTTEATQQQQQQARYSMLVQNGGSEDERELYRFQRYIQDSQFIKLEANCIQKVIKKVLTLVQREQECKLVIATMENSTGVPQKIKNRTTI